MRGDESETSRLIEVASTEALDRGEGCALSVTQWAAGVLNNGLGHYQDALAAVEHANEYPEELWFSTWGCIELLEAAARSGDAERASLALDRLVETTEASGTDLALGIGARSRALVSEGSSAEVLYGEAIERLGRTRVRFELARAHLLYGEWLRRERRRLDARVQLRASHEMFTAMGVKAFAQRAERELLATGETARKRSEDTRAHLTGQEAQVAQLARDGLSNPEIGAQLFISPRTVEYHLHKVFTKLDITSRAQLDRTLPQEPLAMRRI
jgi:DNA-binding CsgD family transcriptional regulator